MTWRNLNSIEERGRAEGQAKWLRLITGCYLLRSSTDDISAAYGPQKLDRVDPP